MTKKQVILLVVAALFAVSGLTALPSGNITGGGGCIVVAAVCAYFGLKKKSAVWKSVRRRLQMHGNPEYR